MSYWRTDHISWKTVLFLLLATPMMSCEPERRPAAFYPIDSLVASQAHSLTGIQAGLFKEALLGGKTDTLRYTPSDTVAWLNELEIFRKLDIINKPVNKGSYQVEDGLHDPASNLTVLAFKSLKKLPVVYLKIYYQGNINKPRKLEALYDEENLLFHSARLVTMNFQQIQNETIMTSYSIKGGQKMIFSDSVAFYIGGKILID